MKSFLLLISIFLFSIQLHSQDWSSWTNCTGDPCIGNLQYKYKFYPMDNGKYELKINFKNNFSERIYFKYIVSNIAQSSGGSSFEGRTEAGSNQETGSWGSWTVTKSVTVPRITIEDVRFGKSDVGGFWRCNHINGFFENPQLKINTGSGSPVNKQNSGQTTGSLTNSNNVYGSQNEEFSFNTYYEQKQQEFQARQAELETQRQISNQAYQQSIQQYNAQAEIAQQKLVESAANLTNMIVQGVADNRRRKEELAEIQRINEENAKREAAMERRAQEEEEREIKRIEQLKRELPSYLDKISTKNQRFYNIHSVRYFYFVAKDGENNVSFSNIFSVLPDPGGNLPFIVDMKNNYQQKLNYTNFWLFGPHETQSSAVQHKKEIISILIEHYWSFSNEHIFQLNQKVKANETSFWGDPAYKAEKKASNNDFWGDSNKPTSIKLDSADSIEKKASSNDFWGESNKATSIKLESADSIEKKTSNDDFWGESNKATSTPVESPNNNQIIKSEELDSFTDETQSAKTNSGNQSEDKTSERWITHTVQSGETLYSIHRKYSVPIDVIKKNNGLVSNNLFVGQNLKILLIK